MSHAVEGLLQAYLDGEMDSTAVAELDRHLVACDACTAELAALRSVNGRAQAALGLLDVPAAPMLRARAAIARERSATSRTSSAVSLGGRSLAKAAMLLLALAGAGAAAIPGSPVRRAVEGAVARVAQWFGAEQQQPVAGTEQEVAPEAEPARTVRTDQAGVAPVDGRVRFVLMQPSAPVELVVVLTDADVARVETEMEETDVSFRTRAGLIQVSGLGSGRMRVMIPRNTREATVELGGRAIVTKQDGLLRSTAPGATTTSAEVRLRIGS